jgi:RNase adaptor protein for sRNA GlmZ degradation
VFDCRAIHNPGRYAEYTLLTGRDEPVKSFLLERSEVDGFLANVFALVKQTIGVYTTRKFTNLVVNFGCTGGRHRSVYCAERLAEHLTDIPDVRVSVRHIEMEKLQGR